MRLSRTRSKSLRREPQRLPDRARPRRAPDHPAAVRLLSDGRSRQPGARRKMQVRSKPILCTSRRTNFCTSATMRASATGTSGSGRVRFPVRTTRRSAACLRASPASSTMRAEKTTMRAAGSSRPGSTSRRGAYAAGASRWRRPTVCACRADYAGPVPAQLQLMDVPAGNTRV